MQIYRIEAEFDDRCGPFWNGDIGDDHPSRNMPSPFDRGEGAVKDFFLARLDKLEAGDRISGKPLPPQRRIVFGFPDQDSFTLWFSASDLASLQARGYVLAVYDVPSPADWAASRSQIIFDRSQGRRIGCDSLTQ